MKREIVVTSDLAMFPQRGRALGSLFSNFLNKRPLCLADVSEMWESLTPEERSSSYDTVTQMRVRTLIGEGKPIQAYSLLVSGLRVDPLNLSLQLELNSVTIACAHRLEFLLSADPQNQEVRILYEILQKEASLSVPLQGKYMAALVNQGLCDEALPIAKSLVELFPAMVGLGDAVEALAIRLPDPTLLRFIAKQPTPPSRDRIRSEMTPARAHELKGRFFRLQELVQGESESPEAEKMLNEILGVWSDTCAIDVSLKEFYYLRAGYLSRHGGNWDALSILQSLVAIDPCSLHFRHALELEVSQITEIVLKKCDNADCKIDLIQVYEVLIQLGLLSYKFLTRVCIAEVNAGAISEAKRKMQLLVALNSYDHDYLYSALEVAVETKDEAWQKEILDSVKLLSQQRPWDPGLAMLAAGA